MKLFSLSLCALLCFFLVSCGKKATENVTLSSSCRLLSVYFNSDSARMYHYDASGKLILKWDMFEQGPVSLSSHYIYQGTRLVCFYRSAADSTFFTWDALWRLSTVERHTYTMGTRQTRTTRFAYNSQNQVVTETNKAQVTPGLKGVLPNDSSVYTYLDQNVRTRDYYYGQDTVYTDHYHYEYTYDTMKNFYAATGEPPVNYYQWSLNNITVKSINGGMIPPDTIRQYNTQGYPVLIKNVQGYTITLNYACP